MSTSGLSASTSSSASSIPMDSTHTHQQLAFPSQDASHESNSTPTQTPRTSQPMQTNLAANDTISAVDSDGSNDRNAGLGMSTPSPPASHHPSPHAGTSHLQPATHIATHVTTDSPLSIKSTAPLSPLSASIPTSAFPRRQPSPPLPSLPPIQRPAQATNWQSSTGSNIPGRSLSFIDPPSQRASGSGRGNNGNGSGYSNRNGSRNDRRTMSSMATSMEKAPMPLDSDTSRIFAIDLGYNDRPRDSRYHDSAIMMPTPAFTEDGKERDSDATGRNRTLSRTAATAGGGGGGGPGFSRMSTDSDSLCMPRFPRTVQERLQPTIDHAMAEEAKYARKAKITGYALNIAIGLQVFLSAMITGLSAITTGRQTQIVTSILGGLGTVVASYLARARGSNEPELSIARTKDLQRFVRTCDSFVQDHGQETGFEDSEGKEGAQDLRRARDLDERIRELRNELEHLLGHGDGERRLAPPV